MNQTADAGAHQAEPKPVTLESTVITLKPMEIRTFVIRFQTRSGPDTSWARFKDR